MVKFEADFYKPKINAYTHLSLRTIIQFNVLRRRKLIDFNYNIYYSKDLKAFISKDTLEDITEELILVNKK